MKVRDLMPMEIDIDVYDNVCDDIGIAFCGPMKLTEAGKQHFEEVLDYPVTLKKYSGDIVAIVIVDNPDKGWEKRLNKAKDFFYSLAGYCDADDYDKWFVEV